MAEANENHDWLSRFERVNSGEDVLLRDRSPKNQDWLSRFEKVSKTSEAQALRQGVIGGAAEFAPVIPATVGGAKIGAAIGALGGPLAPVTVPAGAVVGGIAGAFGGMEVGEYARDYLSDIEDPFDEEGMLTTRTLEEIPAEVRSYGVAGETLGSAMTGGLSFAGAAKTGVKAGETIMTGKWLNPVFNAAKNRTKTFLAAEAGTAVGAATFGGLAEEVYPGDPIARFVAETAGGFIHPSRLIAGSWDMGVGVINKALQSTTQSGQESAAAKVLSEILQEYGEDPVVVAQLLRSDPEFQALRNRQTAAQKSGSEALIALQSSLAKRNAKFGKEATENAKASIFVLNEAIASLRDQGDPESLRAAAALTAHVISSSMQQQVASATSQAKEAISTMVGEGITSRSEISQKAQSFLKQALADVKVEEQKLWANVPKDVPVMGNSIAGEILNIRDNILIAGDKLPPQVEEFAKNYTNLQELTANNQVIPDDLARQFTSGKIQAFRSRMLDLARDNASGTTPNSLNAMVYNRLANAALSDMDEALSADEAYTLARTFTKAKAETFNKTFAGEALLKKGTGAESVDPEVLLAKTFAGGREAVALKSSELVEASGFLSRQNLVNVENVNDYTSDMMDLQEQYLRTFTLDAVQDNGINRSVLRNIQKKNSELLERFPNLSKDISNALKSDKALADLNARIKGKTKVIEDKTALAKLLTRGIAGARVVSGKSTGVVENPAKAISAIIGGSKEPKRDLAKLIGLAKRSEETMRGLQASVLDYAVENAGGDLEKMRSALFDPIDSQTPSIIKIMQQYNAVDSDYIGRLNQIFNEAGKISRAQVGIDTVGEIGEAAGAISDLGARIVGSAASTRLAGSMGSSANSIIVAGAGSRAAQNIMNKIPNNKLTEVIQDAAQNPEFMALLLEKAPDPKLQLEKMGQLHAYLLQAGYFALTDDEQNE